MMYAGLANADHVGDVRVAEAVVTPGDNEGLRAVEDVIGS
jgi:hypothetical protein